MQLFRPGLRDKLGWDLDMLADYIEFLERFSIDRKYYGRLKSKKGILEWEISWNRGGSAEKPWGFKELTADVWHYYTRTQFFAMLNLHQIEEQEVKKGFQEKIRSMLVFSSLMEKYAKELMGSDIVEKSLKDYGDFATSLLESINESLDDSEEKKSSDQAKLAMQVKAPKLTLVKSLLET